jgi:hypothetical protein
MKIPWRSSSKQSEPSVRLLVTVLEADSCEVFFEPEGANFSLNRGDAFTVEIGGPGDGVVEVSYSPEGVSIGAWSGASTVAWDRAGNRLKT